jgi:NDP-sugar pyrophosphorylase family protein
MNDFERYGTVELEKETPIHHFISKKNTFTHQGHINAGYLVLNKAFFICSKQLNHLNFCLRERLLRKIFR